MRWFGEEKDPNQKRRDDGMAEDCQVDWTGLDRTGQDRTRGRETRTSKVEEIETDRDQDQTDQIHTAQQSRGAGGERAVHTSASQLLTGTRQP